MRFPARIFCVVLLLFVSLFRFALPVSAQTNDTLNTLMPTDSSVQMNITTLTQGVFLGFLSSATCILGGVDFTSPKHMCLTYNNQTQKFTYDTTSNYGLLGLGAAGIAMTFNNPVHTSDYFAYLSQNFGLVKSAHAANNGIGFDQLSPITNLWLAFRNIAYLIFVILFIVIGFAVMLRAKIDPRTVMTIENQIPKLIVALLLITFSFAIAGFVIDFMWVGIYLVINLFGNLDPVLKGQIGALTGAVKDNPFNWVNNLNGNGPSGNAPLGFIGIAQQVAGAVKDMTNVIVFNVFQNFGILKILVIQIFGIPILLSCILGQIISNVGANVGKTVSDWFIIGGVINSITGNGAGGAGQTATGASFQNFGACLDAGFATIISSVIGAVAFIIFAVAMLVAIGKLWWSLIKSYTLFLILVIFAPLIIMSGVIPGWTKTNFEWWIRHVLAYAIVFPTAMGVFLLGKTLMDVYAIQTTAAPPLLGVDGKALAFVGPLLGFAVMMLAPQSLAMVQDALNAPDPKYLASIGQAIGVGSAAYGSSVGKLWSRSLRESDPLRGLDEGWLRKILVPQGSLRRRIFVGSETGKANPLGSHS